MAKHESLKYRPPADWFVYDAGALMTRFSAASAVVDTLCRVPYSRAWVEGGSTLNDEVTATSELAGLGGPPESDQLPFERPEVSSCTETYRWISGLSPTVQLSVPLISEVHARLLRGTGSSPGALRRKGEQVAFGHPPQRGAKGGREVRESLEALVDSWGRAAQPLIIKAIALHYHIHTIHPFREGNGRTARALDAIFRQAAGLRGVHVVAMSQYYNHNAPGYFDALSASRHAAHDLTAFLDFALAGLAAQCQQSLTGLEERLRVTLFEHTMLSLFGQLEAGKRRAMAVRQVRILRVLLARRRMPLSQLYEQLRAEYDSLKNPWKAFLRDMHDLSEIEAVEIRNGTAPTVQPYLEWPATITERLFFQHYNDEPRSGLTLSTAV